MIEHRKKISELRSPLAFSEFFQNQMEEGENFQTFSTSKPAV